MANITGKLVLIKIETVKKTLALMLGLRMFQQSYKIQLQILYQQLTTTANGEFEFQNVNDGTYRLIVVGDYAGNTETSPANFANATAGQGAQQSSLPAYTVVPEGNRVAGMNALNAVTPTTETVTVTSNQNVTAPTFFYRTS